MKLVINKCFGGFSICREAFLRLRELGCEAAKKEPDVGELYDDGSGPRTAFGGKLEWESFGREIPRDDPHLVQVVEEMGEKASGNCARVRVVEIPDGVDWEIDDYDGQESVAEKHRSWG
jgi:hypothetical protein